MLKHLKKEKNKQKKNRKRKLRNFSSSDGLYHLALVRSHIIYLDI